MVVVLALIVLLLMTYDSPAEPTDAVPPAAPGPDVSSPPAPTTP